jgi:hypothetical protein
MEERDSTGADEHRADDTGHDPLADRRAALPARQQTRNDPRDNTGRYEQKDKAPDRGARPAHARILPQHQLAA